MEFANLEGGIAAVLDEWNKAENAIKKAEQVNGEVINPAVYELRYAGRRLVEALAEKDNDPDKAIKLLGDAHFDCCRARHDAIDAATAKISSDLDIATNKIGAHNILTYFPEWRDLAQELIQVRELIANSREHRNDRDKIYNVLQNENLDWIVQIHSQFKANEQTMVLAARGERRKYFGGIFVGILGILVGILIALIA